MFQRITNNPTYIFIKEILEILAIIITLSPSIPFLLEFSKNNPKLSVFLGIMMFISILFILKKVKIFYKNFRNRIQEENIKKELTSINQKSDNKDISEIIPSNRKLKKWYEIAQNRAKQWADDSKFGHMNISLYSSPNSKSLGSFSVCFYSHLKQEELRIHFFDKNITEYYEEHPTGQYPEKNFLDGLQNWQRAFITSYKKLSDKIADGVTISISINSSFMFFSYDYHVGSVKVHDFFEYNGKTLKHSRDQSEIVI